MLRATATAPATRTGEERATLQTHLEGDKPRRPGGVAPGGREPRPVTDPAGLLLRLESDGRFHRDRGLGRIYHLGGVSFRENRAADSLHISVHGDRLAAHVDHVSPRDTEGVRTPRYSVRRAVTHNIAGMAHDLGRLLRGRKGDHRCRLDCRWVWDPSESEAHEHDLLSPKASAWSVHLEARVAGSLDEQRLRRALEVVLGNPPIPEETLEVVDCPDDGSLEAARVRLHQEAVWPGHWPPLHAYLARHPAGDVFMVNLNHAAADGFAALQVLDRIARAYARKGGPVRPLDFLATRPVPVRPASAPVSRVMGAYKTLVERLRNRLAHPARLAAEGATEEESYGFHLVRLSPDETARLILAERPGTSRNRLMAGLHLAIGEWNLEHGTPGRQIGVLVPVNLRPPEWSEETIGNFSVTARVSTARRHRSDPSAALDAVTSQTTRNKATRTGIALLAALERTGLLSLWAKQSLVVLQPLTRNRLVDTAMLAHLATLGEAPAFGPDAGDTVELWFSVPARAPLALCVGAVTVAGCLHLTFRYPRRLFGPDAARRFADCYLANVRGIAEQPAI
ncbi:MAG: hypothetical protein M3179_08390 [Actinomycetota bacterium]|nr:hypothetical protein [Actinomycetota bacterium]